jgi:hypothetical protein
MTCGASGIQGMSIFSSGIQGIGPIRAGTTQSGMTDRSIWAMSPALQRSRLVSTGRYQLARWGHGRCRLCVVDTRRLMATW